MQPDSLKTKGPTAGGDREIVGAAATDQPFTIGAASSIQDLRPLVLKHGNTFAVFDRNGDASPGEGAAQGLYHCDTRHLSLLIVTLDGARPILLSSTLRDDNATLTCDLTNPDLADAAGRPRLDHDLIHLRRSRFLWNAGCFERLNVRNFDDKPRRVDLGIAFAADFADLFEVRGARRARRGETAAPVVGASHATLSYTGLDNRRRSTTLRFDPTPTHLSPKGAVFRLDLAPRESRSLFIEIDCRNEERTSDPRRAFFIALRDARRALRASSSRAASIVSSNHIFNEAARRSVADLYMLMTDLPEGPYPYAGIPWFSAVFGRDGIITALETLWIDPSIARGVLGHLAASQATEVDAAADAEPGKILHEARHGEMANLGEVPFRRYYGSVDATPLFVVLAGAYLERTGDLDAVRGLWPHIQSALDWIDRYGDRDGDGFVEYGAPNQPGSGQPGLEGQPRRDLPRRRDGWRRVRSLWSRCRRMSTRPGGPPNGSPGGWAIPSRRSSSHRRRMRCVADSTSAFSTSPSGPMFWRSTATSSLAAFAHPMPATRCSLASPSPNARPRSCAH